MNEVKKWQIGEGTPVREDAQHTIIGDGTGHTLTVQQQPNGKDESAYAHFFLRDDGTWCTIVIATMATGK